MTDLPPSSKYRGPRRPAPLRKSLLGLRSIFGPPILNLWAAALDRARSQWRFTLAGVQYSYFFHRYNRTWRNERAVEIPIILDRLRNAGPGRILEVGNVLGHYFPRSYDVLDKYDDASDVIHEDAEDFRPPWQYSLIVSISTLEHIGRDEIPQDPGKVIRAVENLRRGLAPSGSLLATWPVGYNTELDRGCDDGTLGARRLDFLRRVSMRNEWVEAEWRDVRTLKYGAPFPFANALCVGTFEALPGSTANRIDSPIARHDPRAGWQSEASL